MELVKEGWFRPRVIGKLTKREMDVVELVTQGKTNHEIASELNIDERTARTYVHTILQKWQLGNRTELALYAMRQKHVASIAETPITAQEALALAQKYLAMAQELIESEVGAHE